MGDPTGMIPRFLPRRRASRVFPNRPSGKGRSGGRVSLTLHRHFDMAVSVVPPAALQAALTVAVADGEIAAMGAIPALAGRRDVGASAFARRALTLDGAKLTSRSGFASRPRCLLRLLSGGACLQFSVALAVVHRALALPFRTMHSTRARNRTGWLARREGERSPRGWRGDLILAGSGILRGDPTPAAALEAAPPAEADEGSLGIKRVVVDTIPGHGIDLLGVRQEDVLRRCDTRHHAGDDHDCKS